MPQNRISDTIMQVILNTINGEVVKQTQIKGSYYAPKSGCVDGCKRTKKRLRYLETIVFYSQMPKSSSKMLFELNFLFHGDLYCCVKFSNVHIIENTTFRLHETFLRDHCVISKWENRALAASTYLSLYAMKPYKFIFFA